MKAPIGWLKEFVKISESPKKLGEIFTLLGAEAETIDSGVLDLEVTPNRPDWLSIYGLARELGAYLGRKVRQLEVSRLGYAKKSKILDISFADKNLFPRYGAIVLDNVSIAQSPKFVKDRLKKVGVNVHNNIIDATNYVMLELGVPLHAFDLDRIEGNKILLRESKAGETLKTLDGMVRQVPVGSLVIEDGVKLIDLMGIKGGENSSVVKSTKRVLLQANVNDPKRVRSASKGIGLSTEASYRFERGVDQTMIRPALEAAVKLIFMSCKAKVVDAVDIINREIPRRIINFDSSRAAKLLGTEIAVNQVKNILEKLGFTIKDSVVAVPSWRMSDVYFEEDLTEEVARLYGYNKLKRKIIERRTARRRDGLVKKFLAQSGFSEIISYSMVSKKEVDDRAVALAKPLSPESAFLRTNLTAGIVKAAARSAWAKEIKIFEIGSVFTPTEHKHIALASSSSLPYNLPTQKININHPLGKLNKIRRSIYAAELAYSEFLKKIKITPAVYNGNKISYRPISVYPPVVRDIATIVDNMVDSKKITGAIQDVDARIILVELFDEFRHRKFGKNKKSLAFRMVFEDKNKTLTDAQVDKIMDKVSKTLENGFGAIIR